MMQLLVITLDNSEEFLKTLAGLKDHGMNAIVMPSTSLKHALLHSNVEEVPIFGSISRIVRNDFEMSHTIMMLVPEEKLQVARDVVIEITRGLGRKGVMFALPVTFWEGIDF